MRRSLHTAVLLACACLLACATTAPAPSSEPPAAEPPTKVTEGPVEPGHDAPTPERRRARVGPQPAMCNASNIVGVLRSAAPRLRACYAAHEPVDPSGRLDVGFTIGTEGRVTEVAIRGTGIGNETRDCLAKELKKLRFEKPAGGTCQIRYPTNFAAQ